jgi:hypothetical protein
VVSESVVSRLLMMMMMMMSCGVVSVTVLCWACYDSTYPRVELSWVKLNSKRGLEMSRAVVYPSTYSLTTWIFLFFFSLR